MNKLGRNKTLYLKKLGCVFKNVHYDWMQENEVNTEIWTDHNEYVGLADLGKREYCVNFIYKHRLTNLMSVNRALGKPLSKTGCNTVSVGFSEKEQAWYGWTHRGYSKFSIDNVIFEGSIFDEYVKNKYPFPIIIETLDQAKEFAAYLADYLD